MLAASSSHSLAARAALATLCETYWYPLYVYVRRQGYEVADAQDLVQSFVITLLERDDFRGLRPDRGRFRGFLLASLRHFLENRRVYERAIKRGGGHAPLSFEFKTAEDRYVHEPADLGTPETIFDRNWALALLDLVFRRIRAEWEAKGKGNESYLIALCNRPSAG